MKMILFCLSIFVMAESLGAEPEKQELDLSTYEGLSLAIQTKFRNLLIIDVRASRDFYTGYIPTAINIPVSRLLQSQPSKNFNTIIVVYGWSWATVERGADMLDNMGYKNIILFGPLSKWQGELSGVKN